MLLKGVDDKNYVGTSLSKFDLFHADYLVDVKSTQKQFVTYDIIESCKQTQEYWDQ